MIRVNAERLWSTLEMMAQIGGTPAGGDPSGAERGRSYCA
jgi:hypothetical protein